MELKVRAAKFEDYKAVMDMNKNVYDGADYLICYYHIYIQSPDCHAFVGEIGGRIVAYFCLRVTNGGLSLLSVAGRVRLDLNGQGIFFQMARAAVRKVKDMVPSVREVIHCSVDAPHVDKLPGLLLSGKAEENMILKTHLLNYSFSAESLKNYSLTNRMTLAKDTSILSPDKACKVFEDASNLVCLFPSGYVLAYQNCRPLRAWYETIREIVTSHYTVCTFRNGSTTKLLAISFSYAVQTVAGFRNMVYYFDITPNIALLRAHAALHFEHTKHVSPASDGRAVFFNVMFPIGYDKLATKKAVQPFLGEPTSSVRYQRQASVSFCGPVVPIVLHSAKL